MKNNSNDKHRYDDIINLPHHNSTIYPRMSMSNRAAQFSPFAALIGYGDAIKETQRLTDQKIELDEGTIASLSEKLRMIQIQLPNGPKVQVTYFKPDEYKAGGAYITKAGCIKKIDEFERIVVMEDNEKIAMEAIVSIEGDMF